MLRFSANLGFLWSDLPLLDRVRAAAAAGFTAVELHWPFDMDPIALRRACREHRVELLAFNSEPGDVGRGEFGLASLPGREADFAMGLARAIAYASAAGAGAIHVLAGPAPADHPAAARDTFIGNLRRAADAAFVGGLTLLLEAMNPSDRPGYFYSTVDAVTDLLTAIDRENVRLLFDVYHAGRTEPDVHAALRRSAPWIGHLQIAGVPGRAEPDEGHLDYRAVFRTLETIGYRGWIGCEYRPRSTPEAGLGWLADLTGRAPGTAE